MPLEYSFTGRSMNAPISANAFDRGKYALHFAARDAQDFAVQKDVFAAGEFRIESRAQFEQRGDPPLRDHAARVGSRIPLTICSSVLLPLPFGPTTPKNFAALDVEIHIAQRPEFVGA